MQFAYSAKQILYSKPWPILYFTFNFLKNLFDIFVNFLFIVLENNSYIYLVGLIILTLI